MSESNEKPTVYFNVRVNARERMWETVRAADDICEVKKPLIAEVGSVARTANKKTVKLTQFKKKLSQLLPLINYQSTDTLTPTVDLQYLWGAFPKQKSKIPYCVEIDNPYVLTYYNVNAFKLYRKTLRQKLSQAQNITFLSKAALNHTVSLVGKNIEGKSLLFSPFMSRNYHTHKRSLNGEIRFLFVGLDWRRKGGPELLKAFSSIRSDKARLTIVSRVPQVERERYAGDSRITFLAPKSRKVLFTEIYPNHDIFVLPSFHESLGVVLLEALSFGMGIITMDTYGASEFVSGSNGFVIPHPVLSPTIFNGVPIIDCVSMESHIFYERYLQPTAQYHQVEEDLKKALQLGIDQQHIWKDSSISLFESEYSPDIWKTRAQQIFKGT